MSKLGMADLGIVTLNDMRDNAAMIASLDRKGELSFPRSFVTFGMDQLLGAMSKPHLL